MPAWCDRILWKRNPKVSQLTLFTCQEMTFSDHRPVTSQFQIYSDKINTAKTAEAQAKYYEKARFQSMYVFGGLQKASSTPVGHGHEIDDFANAETREDGNFGIVLEETQDDNFSHLDAQPKDQIPD